VDNRTGGQPLPSATVKVGFRGAYRRSADFIDRILNGAKPIDIPVEFPTKLYLAVNLRTAKAIGLKIGEAFLLRADEVIE
jgi:putative tryptophan/tyrosine transport system substrate-binding protein